MHGPGRRGGRGRYGNLRVEGAHCRRNPGRVVPGRCFPPFAFTSVLLRMPNQTPAEHELAQLLVQSLNLEEVDPASIDPAEPLFGAGLGLDSIDALELALAISKRYGFQLRSDNDDNRRIFGSLKALSEHVEQNRSP